MIPCKSIMVVEDERIVAEDLRDRLAALGYEVRAVASSGEEAIRLLEKANPDLILMDIRLRGAIDGIQTAEQIHSQRDVPIVYLTAYADDNTFQRAMSTEPFGYILKPVENRELHTSIEMALFKHRMEQQLRESEEWLQTTLRSIGDAVIATNADGKVRFMNSVAERLTGWKQHEALDRNLDEVFERVKEAGFPGNESSIAMLQNGSIAGIPSHSIYLTRNGQSVPIDESIAPIRDHRGRITGIVVVFKDATDRLRTELTLKDISKHILEAQEAERRRVARELHDSVIQLLSSVKYRLNAVEEEMGAQKQNTLKSTNKVKELLEKAIVEVRRISRNLRPSELDDLGLIPAIRIAVDEFQERTGIECSFKATEIPDTLPADLALSLYRIIQESLSNIEKHARASKVKINLSTEGGILLLFIKDNGKGFDPKTIKSKGRKSGLGLLDMMERAEFINGTLQLHAAIRKGTEIRLSVPLLTRT